MRIEGTSQALETHPNCQQPLLLAWQAVVKRFWLSAAAISTVALFLAAATAVSQASREDAVQAMGEFGKALLWACYFASAMGWSYGRYRASVGTVHESSRIAFALAFALGGLATLLVYCLLPALAAAPTAGKDFAPVWFLGVVFSVLFALTAGTTLQLLLWVVRVWFEGTHKCN